jgi:sugar phosphate isomerase/epimerase
LEWKEDKMFLALNTFVYEVGRVQIEYTLKSAYNFGFRFIDYAAYNSGDPTIMPRSKQKDIVKIFKEYEFKSSQLLLANTQYIASTDISKRMKTLDYMKECADFQLELGGRQVLVCWGCGVYESGVMQEENWINSVNSIREYANWCLDRGILIDLELDPHVYFVVNNTQKMAKIIEDINMPNVFANVDIGHLCITREMPTTLEKLKDRVLHIHISETDSFEHTNSIIGTGKADFSAYIDFLVKLDIEKNCQKYGEICTAGIEMGEPGRFVDDPDYWVRQSLEYLNRVLPELKL